MTDQISKKVMMSTGMFEKEKEYWLDKLSGEITFSSFSQNGRRSQRDVEKRECLTFGFPGEVYDRLMRIGNASEYGMFMLLLSGLSCLLYKYTENEDIVLGTPVFKQEDSRDYFNTILALRSKVNGEMTFKDLLLHVKQVVSEANEHMNYPFEEVMKQLNRFSGDDPSPLFDVMMGFKNIHVEDVLKGQRCGTVFSFFMADGHIESEIDYDPALFESQTVQSLSAHFINCLAAAAREPLTRLANIDVLSAEEKQQLLVEFNDSAVEYPIDKMLHELFAEQAAKTPHAAAIVFEKRTLTYGELNEKSNRLARILRGRGMIAGEIAGIMLKRSPEVVTAILAVLKAGGVCFPIDLENPTGRIKSMLADCQSPVLITETAAVRKHSFVHLLDLDANKSEPLITSLRPQITDFDGLPFPDRSLVRHREYDPYIGETNIKNTYISMQATRGCPYNCMYCHKIWPKKHIFRSAENIFQEVKLYYDMGVRRFSFVDDVFNLNIKNSRRFYELVIENDLDIQFLDHNGLRGDVLTREYIDLMIRAGAISFSLALETASPRLQKLIRKDLNINKLRENLEYICDKYPQVILELFTMHGFPTESEEEAMMTLNFIKGLKWVHFPYVNILRIYSNTEMEKLALENNITRDNILASEGLAYHELPRTLPFDKSFTLKYQADFLDNYFLSKERLLHVLPYQLKVFTRDEMVQKYNSYFPVHLKSFDDFLRYIDISGEELGVEEYLDEDHTLVPHLDQKLKEYFPQSKPDDGALRVLLLDLSQLFNVDKGDMLYDMVETPLGLMYLMTYLKQQLGGKVKGKIAKSRIDFDSYEELKILLEEFKPDLIGIRTLTFYRDFFHKAAAVIRQWGYDGPIAAGGPYATSDYNIVLQDRNIDLVILGEGEITFTELVEKMLENGGKLPGKEVLKEIKGIAFIPGSKEENKRISRTIVMLDELKEELGKQSSGNLVYDNSRWDYAYITFSSGSTGKPKGAMLYHWGISNHVFTKIKELGVGADDVLCHSLNISFVASIWQFFAPLFTGTKFHLYPGGVLSDPYEFFRQVEADGVSVAEVVPSYLSTYLEVLGSGKRKLNLESLRMLVLTGEKVSPSLVDRFYREYRLELLNAYGQSECSDDTLHYRIPYNKETAVVPIGTPANNTQIFILDKNRQLQPVGVYGELCISGDGLAPGYLNSPELTAGKFISNPHMPGKKMFLTGDIARWLPDGNIEFSGRIDQQVKIRGYRIELDEIKNCLLNHDKIRDAVLMAGENRSNGVSPGDAGDRYLCAYVAAVPGSGMLNIPDLRDYLSGELPDYMIPSYFVPLENIPLTASGKVDWNTLPDPRAGSLAPGENGAGPRDEIDRKLMELWSEILKLEKEKIGMDTNFFESGGNSLKSVTLVARIHKELDVNLTLTEIFENPTIKGLSEFIRAAAKEQFIPLEPLEQKEYYVLSSSQKRLYILQQIITMEKTSYNMPSVQVLEGIVQKEKLEYTFAKLIERHESFRTSFELLETEPVQRIHPPGAVDFALEYHDLAAGEARASAENPAVEAILHGFVRPFDLSAAPLIRAGLVKLAEAEHIFMVDMHHIILDGTSMGIFIKDFIELLAGKDLVEMRIQYKDFSGWQQRSLKSGDIAKQEQYWLKEFEGDIPVLNIPTDYPRPLVQSFEGNVINFEIDRELTGRILDLVSQTNTTLFMVLLAIYYILLSKYTGQEDIVVGSSIAGRSHADIQGIIGMFINMLSLRNRPVSDRTFREFLEEVRENVLNAFENRDYPYDELVAKLGVQGKTNRNPLFDVVFAVQNVESGEIDVDSVKELGPFRIYPYSDFEHEVSKFDLALLAEEENDIIKMFLPYNRELFKPVTAEKITQYYIDIMKQVVENPGMQLKDVKIHHDLLIIKPNIQQADMEEFEF